LVDSTAEELAIACAHVGDERKGENITVLNVGDVSSLTDYFVIITGRNPRHLRALRKAMEEKIDELGGRVMGVEGEPDAGWVLVDAEWMVVHLFSSDKRELYDLEMLWGDCPRIDWSARQPLQSGSGE